MSSPTVRGALIGGILGVVLHLIVRFLIRNLVWLAVAAMLIWVLAKCSPENPKAASKQAILSSFDPNSVLVLNARGITTSYSTAIGEISATIQNTGRARIYDLWLNCSFRPLPPSSPSKAEPQWDIARVRTNYHLGYIAPGAQVNVRVIPEPDGYLREADPNNFTCSANFEIEKGDVTLTKTGCIEAEFAA
jgi:hypothetical protein